MILQMIKTGKRAVKKCRKSFNNKAKIMRAKRRALARKGEIIEKKAKVVKRRFTKEI